MYYLNLFEICLPTGLCKHGAHGADVTHPQLWVEWAGTLGLIDEHDVGIVHRTKNSPLLNNEATELCGKALHVAVVHVGPFVFLLFFEPQEERAEVHVGEASYNRLRMLDCAPVAPGIVLKMDTDGSHSVQVHRVVLKIKFKFMLYKCETNIEKAV